MGTAEFSGRTALVAGGTTGIGLAVACLLKRAGAHLIVSGRNPARGRTAVAQIGRGTQFVAADLADLDAVDYLARQAPVDVLVNAAPLANPETYRGTYSLVATIVPSMVRHGGGVIVTVATSAPMEALARTLAREFATEGIRVNTVAPATGARSHQIAEAVVFLASPRAISVTGATVRVDRGAASL